MVRLLFRGQPQGAAVSQRDESSTARGQSVAYPQRLAVFEIPVLEKTRAHGDPTTVMPRHRSKRIGGQRGSRDPDHHRHRRHGGGRGEPAANDAAPNGDHARLRDGAPPLALDGCAQHLESVLPGRRNVQRLLQQPFDVGIRHRGCHPSKPSVVNLSHCTRNSSRALASSDWAATRVRPSWSAISSTDRPSPYLASKARA